ncbi:MAG: RNA 2',3'-cyclic phosphodiesterase [Armatimonadota bacterium]|nr:RNA 2',3'-cyclic phosphodiesterase [Armatimonadota bacterium]
MPDTLHRTFIAVALDPALRRALEDCQERMRQAGARLRWVHPEHLHVTLRFLGAIPLAQVARATVAAREAAATVEPFEIRLGGLGVFPGPRRPQVVWVGTREGAEALGGLAAALAAALRRHGFPEDPRPFRPHVTLARVKDQQRWGDVVRAIEQHRDVEIGRQRVAKIEVMESQLTPEGPVYTVRKEVPLGQRLNSTPA